MAYVEVFAALLLPLTTLLMVIVIILLIYKSLTGTHTIFEPLSKTEAARGLITFLIALVTVSIAIILALYGLFGTGERVKEQFALVKEVLNLLIGILGTIVGYYFGLSTGTQTIQIAPAYITNENPPKGGSTTIVSFITGGKPPYTYSIVFNPQSIEAISNIVTQNGSIQQQVNIPANLNIPANTDVTFQIEARDSENRVANYSDTTKKFTVR